MSGRTHYTAAEADGMERAARIAAEFADADADGRKAKAHGDQALAEAYTERPRGYIIAGAIRVKAKKVGEGDYSRAASTISPPPRTCAGSRLRRAQRRRLRRVLCRLMHGAPQLSRRRFAASFDDDEFEKRLAASACCCASSTPRSASGHGAHRPAHRLPVSVAHRGRSIPRPAAQPDGNSDRKRASGEDRRDANVAYQTLCHA